ncbi:MAG: MAPEG family protein [Devosia sp.]
MSDLALTNPVFSTYVVCAALGVLKIVVQGWDTAIRLMQHNAGYASPEDLRRGPLNPHPDPTTQLAPNEAVERSRRIHRNDLENIPAFLAAGLLFVLVDPPLWLAQLTMYGFVLARIAHGLAYATAQSHEMRATFYTIGSLMTAYMALHALVAAVASGNLF